MRRVAGGLLAPIILVVAWDAVLLAIRLVVGIRSCPAARAVELVRVALREDMS